MAKLTSSLYKLARSVNTAQSLTSGDSKRAGRRVKNIAVGAGPKQLPWREFSIG